MICFAQARRMIASSCSRSICNPYFGDFWETMTWIMSKSLALLQWVFAV